MPFEARKREDEIMRTKQNEWKGLTVLGRPSRPKCLSRRGGHVPSKRTFLFVERDDQRCKHRYEEAPLGLAPLFFVLPFQIVIDPTDVMLCSCVDKEGFRLLRYKHVWKEGRRDDDRGQ
jgi:hypothetical protein